MTLRMSLLLLALLAADYMVAYAAIGPCVIIYPGKVYDSLSCTGSIYPPLPPGCAGSLNVYPEQSSCAGFDSTSPCSDGITILSIIYPSKLVPTQFGPCYGVAVGFLGLTTIQTYNCGVGFPLIFMGGEHCN